MAGGVRQNILSEQLDKAALVYFLRISSSNTYLPFLSAFTHTLYPATFDSVGGKRTRVDMFTDRLAFLSAMGKELEREG